jgi:hypothetical protein
MPPKVVTKNRLQPRAEVEEEVEETVETKAEPKKQVIVSKGLATLMTKWKNAFGQYEAYFPQACAYIIREGTSRDELKQALIEYRGLEAPTLNNELSVLWRVKDHPEEVEACLNEEINPDTGQVWRVKDLRKVGAKPQLNRTEKSTEDKFVDSMDKVAIYAIKEVKLGLNDFINQARVSYREKHAEITGQKVKAQAAAKENDEEEEAEFGEEGEE